MFMPEIEVSIIGGQIVLAQGQSTEDCKTMSISPAQAETVASWIVKAAKAIGQKPNGE